MIAISDLTQRHLWCLDWILNQRMEGLEIVAWLRVARVTDDCTKKNRFIPSFSRKSAVSLSGKYGASCTAASGTATWVGLAVLPSQNMLRQIGWSTTSHSQTPFPPPENAESSSNFLALHDWNGSTEPPCQHWIWPCVRRYWLLPWQPVGWLNSKCPLHFCKRKTGRLEKPSGQKLWSRETWSWCLQRIAASLQTEPCGVCEKMEDIGPSASEICEKKSQNEARKFGCRLSGSYLNLHIAFD